MDQCLGRPTGAYADLAGPPVGRGPEDSGALFGRSADTPPMTGLLSTRTAIWLAVAGGLAVAVGANAQFLYLAVTTQPECLAHVRPGESNGQPGAFSAAQSACSPRRQSE